MVMPAFNAEGTIERSILSVLSQTRSDLELVVVDDGSVDGTSEIVHSYCLQDQRIRVVRHERNRGVSEAINSGVAASTFDRIAILAADDEFAPNFVELLHRRFTRDVDVVIFGHSIVRPDNSELVVSAGKSGVHTGREAAILAMWDRISGLSGGTVVKRTLMLEVPFPSGLRRYEDLATNIALFSWARTVFVLDEPAYRYFVRDDSATWGRLASADEVEAALRFLHQKLNPLVKGAQVEAAFDGLRLLCLLVSAQSAMHRDKMSPEDEAHVRHCAKAITWPQVVGTLRRRPDLALGAVLLKTSRTSYGKLYRRYAAHRYRPGTS